MNPDQLHADILRLQRLGANSFPRKSRSRVYRDLFYQLLDERISARDYLKLRKRLVGTDVLRGTNEVHDAREEASIAIELLVTH